MACPFDITPQSPSNMPNATVGVYYSSDIIASNGISPYTFLNISKYTPIFSGVPYDTLLGGLSANYISPDILRISGIPLSWQTQVSSQDTQNPNASIWSHQVLGTDKFTFGARIVPTCNFDDPQTPLFQENGIPQDGIQCPILRIVQDNPGTSVFVVVQGDRTNSIGFNGRIWSNTFSGGVYNTNDGGSMVVGTGTYYDNINDETYIQWPVDYGTQPVGDGFFYYYTTLAPGSVPLPLFGIGDSISYIENLLNNSLRPEWAARVRFRVFASTDPNWLMPVIFLESFSGSFWCPGPYTIQYSVYNAFSQRFSSSSQVGGNDIQFNFDVIDSNNCSISVQETIPLIANCPPHTILPLQTELPIGKKGIFYSITFTTVGGTPPYTYFVYSGSIPVGMTLNSVSGELSGIPTMIGTYTFTIQSKDANGCTCDCKEYTLIINKNKKRRVFPYVICIQNNTTNPDKIIFRGVIYEKLQDNCYIIKRK